MTKKTKQLIIAVIAVFVVGIATWAFINYKAKREKIEQYNSALAERFDKTMTIAYPLLESYVVAMEDRADSIEALAKKSEETDSLSFNEAFGILWEKYVRTQGARKSIVLLEEFEFFKTSPVLERLLNSGEKRQKEADAIQKITVAGNRLVEPYLLPYDSLMNTTKRAKQYLSDGLEVLKPYRSDNTNFRSWRDIH